MFSYVISGNRYKAVVVRSALNWIEFRDWFRLQTKAVHEDSSERLWKGPYGDIVNPKVTTVRDFVGTLPAILENPRSSEDVVDYVLSTTDGRAAPMKSNYPRQEILQHLKHNQPWGVGSNVRVSPDNLTVYTVEEFSRRVDLDFTKADASSAA